MKTNHIVIDSKSQSFKCMACGVIAGIDFKDGIAIKELISIGRNFKKDHMKCIKKNCHNCKHIDYYESDYEEFSDSGFTCDKRQANLFDSNKESAFLWKLNNGKYRGRQKKCFEPIELSL